MNTGLAINDIIEELKNHNYFSIVQEINNRVSSGSTGTEILMSVAYFLKHLDKENVDAYNLLRDKIESLDKYLQSIGLLIR